MLGATLTGLVEACAALGDALDDEFADAADRGAAIVAASAASEHWYENQTNAAAESTKGLDHAGAWLAGTLTMGVEIGVEYGEYLEARAPVLAQAWLATEDQVAAEFDAAMTRAVAKTPGWSAA